MAAAAAAAALRAAVAGGDDELILLKVPKWLSDIWLNSAPETSVAELSLDATGTDGALRLLVDGGHEFPLTLGVERRSSPELFAFSQQQPEKATAGQGEVRVDGRISEALTLRPALGDSAYMTMLRQRAEGGAIEAGSRSQHDSVIQHPTNAPKKQDIVGSSTDSYMATRENDAEIADVPLHPEVSLAVERFLQSLHGHGATYQDLIAALPEASPLIAVRDSLVASADCRIVGGVKQYFLACRDEEQGGAMRAAAAEAACIMSEPSPGLSRLKRARR